jgi:hypothetical protein
MNPYRSGNDFHIYFVAAGEQAIKIGLTASMSLVQRVWNIRAHNFEQITFLGAIGGSRDLERNILQACLPFHIRGEWFRHCPAMLTIIGACLAAGREVVTGGGFENMPISTVHAARVTERASMRGGYRARQLHVIAGGKSAA